MAIEKAVYRLPPAREPPPPPPPELLDIPPPPLDIELPELLDGETVDLDEPELLVVEERDGVYDPELRDVLLTVVGLVVDRVVPTARPCDTLLVVVPTLDRDVERVTAPVLAPLVTARLLLLPIARETDPVLVRVLLRVLAAELLRVLCVVRAVARDEVATRDALPESIRPLLSRVIREELAEDVPTRPALRDGDELITRDPRGYLLLVQRLLFP